MTEKKKAEKKEEICVSPGPGNTLLNTRGETIQAPAGWSFLPAGDAGITRKVTAAGQFWRVQVKMGRRTISKGIWAPAETIRQATAQMNQTRNTAEYQKKTDAARKYREKKQDQYVDTFYREVLSFLNFHPLYESQASEMARQICEHATPVGSGTVARTERIPVEERAQKAVIAWMRHKTTAYDEMQIARIKGERRRIRRMLAERSVQLLDAYRKGISLSDDCPLNKALKQ